MLNGIVEFLGWFGAVTVLAGYILFSTGKLPNGPLYQSFNLVGGLAVAVNVAAHHAVPSTIVNGIWAVVAGVVIVRTVRARRAAARGVPVVVEEPALLVEPPATTAVLPVVGPALRDHESETTDATETTAAPVVSDATETTAGPAATVVSDATTATDATALPDPAPRLPVGAHGADGDAPTAAAPMTESVPVITATIALALVAAAQEHAGDRRSDAPATSRPDHADSATA